MLTLHTLAYIVKRDQTDEFVYSLPTANSEVPESNSVWRSHTSIIINQYIEESSVSYDM